MLYKVFVRWTLNKLWTWIKSRPPKLTLGEKPKEVK